MNQNLKVRTSFLWRRSSTEEPYSVRCWSISIRYAF